MTGDGRRALPLAALVAVVILSAARPADAVTWTKEYKFKNQTGKSQTSVSAKLIGIETVKPGNDYAIPDGWHPSGTTILQGIPYYTKLTFPGVLASPPVSVGPNVWVYVGWTTSDNSCRCCDLRWGDQSVVVDPVQISGVPGGGVAFFDFPEPGKLTVVITNDNPAGSIDLSNVECAVSPTELDLGGLSSLLSTGWGALVPQKLRDQSPAAFAGPPPAYPPLNARNYVALPDIVTKKLQPRQYTSLVKDVQQGQAFIIRGSVGTGDAKVDWIEQVTR